MKGKLLLEKMTRPSVVFAAGVLVVMFLLSFFLYLHICSANKTVEINNRIEYVETLIVKSLAESPGNSSSLAVLHKAVEQLNNLPGMDIFLSLYTNVLPDKLNTHPGSKDDIISLYNQIHLVQGVMHKYTLEREQTFTEVYVLIQVVVIAMFLLLGINQFANFHLIRKEQERNITNIKLYDQLERERSLLAFELHDDIAQKLAVLKRYFNGRNSIDEHTNLMEEYTSEVIKRVRYLSRMLKAPDNPDISFKDYLETLFPILTYSQITNSTEKQWV